MEARGLRSLLARTAVRSLLLAACVVFTMLVGWWGKLREPAPMLLYAASLGLAGGLAFIPEWALSRREPSIRLGLGAGALTALCAPLLFASAFVQSGHTSASLIVSPLAALEQLAPFARSALLEDERPRAMFLALAIPFVVMAFARRAGLGWPLRAGLAVVAAVATAACFDDPCNAVLHALGRVERGYYWTVPLCYPRATGGVGNACVVGPASGLALEFRLVADQPVERVAVLWALAVAIAGEAIRLPALSRRSAPPLAALLAGGIVLIAGHGSSVAQTGGADGLIAIETGTLPIILSAPHGGREPIPGVPERRTGTRVADEYTGEIAALVAAELERELRAKPSVVRALFHRKYLDANRAEAEGLEDAGAKPVYAAYHAALRRFVDAARRSSPGRALLVDLHGQNKEPDTLVRGTRDGKSVKALLARAGGEALVGSKSIFGQLSAAGYRTDPPPGAPLSTRENRSFDGGFIVATYGSHQEDGVDAIQIEIGRELRHDPGPRQKLARDLARAIATFYRAHVARR